jgi:hypothetical protein
VPDQDQFVEASEDQQSPDLVLVEDASDEDDEQAEPSLPCTAEQLQTLRSLIGDDFDAGSGVGRIIERLRSSDLDDSAEGQSTDLQAELASAREQVLQLSARLPPVMPQEVQAALVESATAKFDATVAKGSLSPAVRDKLVAALVENGEGGANVIAFSRTGSGGGSRSLAFAIAEILLDNSPINLGERTGLQAMARHVPGEDSSPMDQLRQYMTKIASVSG